MHHTLPGRAAFGLATTLAATLALGTLASSASANGRFPESLDLAFQPGDGGLIAGSATFGLLLSDDAGLTWAWVCEDAIGYRGIWNPIFVITEPGTLYASTAESLRISRDGGCTWNPGPGAMATAWVNDLVLAPDGAVWVAMANTAGGNDVFVSRDDGVTFEPQGLSAFAPNAFWKSIRVAPGDPTVVYASGYHITGGEPRPLLFRRDADGWVDLAFAFGTSSQLKLLGVSPADPDLVFARIDEEPTDTVLRSENGGASFAMGPVINDNVSTFVFWPDGEIFLGTKFEGTQRSPDNGLTWARSSERLTSPALYCGHNAPDGQLWGCGSNWDPDRFAYGTSADRGATFSKVMRFAEIMAPLDCPTGTPQDSLCEPDFTSSICAMFACDSVDGGAPTADARRVDAAGPGGDGGGGGCGCGVALAAMIVVPVGPFRRRRRARADRAGAPPR